MMTRRLTNILGFLKRVSVLRLLFLSLFVSFFLTTGVYDTQADVTTASIDTSNLHPDRDAIPASNFDLQQLKSLAEQIKAAAEDCGKGFKCPVMDCAAANMLRQILLEAKLHLQDMKGWSSKASNDFLAHRNSLVEQSIITDTNRGNAIWAQGVNKFLHDFGSMLLDIAALAGTIEDLAKDGLDPSKVKNLDKLYETLKTYESLVDTVADNLDPSTATEGTGPLNDLTKDADGMLGLENTSIGSVKSDLSDTISAIENFKGGKPWKGGRDVGQIIGRILKDLSQAEMNERAARIAELARDLRAEEDVTTAAHNDYIRAAERRNIVEDTSTALDAAYNAVIACIRKHCPLSSVARPTSQSFTGWGSALRHYNALIPRIRTSLQGAIGGLTFKEREDCVDPLVSLPDDDPFAAMKDAPIVPDYQTGGHPSNSNNPLTVNCTGSGCTEGITGICFGDSCTNTFDLYCPGSGCVEDILVSCSGDGCSNNGTVDCKVGECGDRGAFACVESSCEAVPTHSILDDLGYDKTDFSNFTFNANLIPRQNTTIVPRTQTCTLCQSIADQLYEIDVRLNDLENNQSLWESVEEQPEEMEKLYKEQEEKEVERKKLAEKLKACENKCPKEDLYIDPIKSTENNCVGTGCSEGITETCIGDTCSDPETPVKETRGFFEEGFDKSTYTEPPGFYKASGAACPKCSGFADARNQLIVKHNELEERLERIKSWLKEAWAEYSLAISISNRLGYEMSKSHYDKNKRKEYLDAHDAAMLKYKRVENLKKRDKELRQLSKDIGDQIALAALALANCEKKWCTTVELIDVISLSGNQPFDRRDPISENNDSTTSTTTGTTTPAATVNVIFCAGCGGGVDIKVPQAGVFIAGPDACPTDHYHGGPATGCDGNVYADPAPGVCGFGQVPNTTSVPATSCPTP